MPKKNPKKQKKTTSKKNHNVKVKGKKNNVNQNNIHIKIGDNGSKTPAYSTGSSSFGYPVYMQSPLMQNTAPAQPAFGSAAPVRNSFAEATTTLDSERLYHRNHRVVPVDRSVQDDTMSSITEPSSYSIGRFMGEDNLPAFGALYESDSNNTSVTRSDPMSAFSDGHSEIASTLARSTKRYNTPTSSIHSTHTSSTKSDVKDPMSAFSDGYSEIASTLARSTQSDITPTHSIHTRSIRSTESEAKPVVHKYELTEDELKNQEELVSVKPAVKEQLISPGDEEANAPPQFNYTAGEVILVEDIHSKDFEYIKKSKDYTLAIMNSLLQKLKPGSAIYKTKKDAITEIKKYN